MIAKYFATSLAIENVVSAPRVISSCLPISTISISLVGFESRSTMLPASFAACVPVFIATPTSACASAGASLVPSPVIATSLPSRLLALDQRHLVFGRRLGEEVVDARFGRDRRRGQRVVAGDHHRLDPHRAQVREALADAALDDVLQVNDAERVRALGDDERRAAGARDALDDAGELRGPCRLGDDPLLDRVGRALADLAPSPLSPPLPPLPSGRRPTCASAR